MKRTAKTRQKELANTPPSKDASAETGIEDGSPLQFWSKEFAFKRATTPVSLAGVDAPGPKPETCASGVLPVRQRTTPQALTMPSP